MEHGAPVFLRVPAHCIDTDWPWWRPIPPWEWNNMPTTKLINISDECKDGCKYDALYAALEKVGDIVETWRNEATQSSSIRRRYMQQIDSTVKQALGR